MSNKYRAAIFFIAAILISAGIAAAANETIAGRVYVWHDPAVQNNIVTKDLSFDKTTMEYESQTLTYFSTQYGQWHLSPNFFYFACIGTSNYCFKPSITGGYSTIGDIDPNGGEVYIDDYSSDGSQVQLQIHTPWDTWDAPTVNKNSYITYTYSGADQAWAGSIYTVYINTWLGSTLGGIFIKTQLVTTVSGGHYNQDKFIDTNTHNPPCPNGAVACITNYFHMPDGIGTVYKNRTHQAFYVNASEVPDLANVTSYKVGFVADMINPAEGGYLYSTEPVIPGTIPELYRINPADGVNTFGKPYIVNILTSSDPQVWYEISGFTTPLQSNPVFAIGMGTNLRVYYMQLIVTYNSSANASVNEIPLKNVAVSLDSVNTTTDSNGYYLLPFPDAGEHGVGYDGFYAQKAGEPFWGEQKTISFTGNNTTTANVWLNESISTMAGSIVFNGVNNGTFAIGQQMNISYALYHPDHTNYTFSIDLYKPILDYNSTMVLDNSILLTNDSGNWIPPTQDTTTRGERTLYLNYTSRSGGAPTTLATLSANYGSLSPNGTITTDKQLYNMSETALINYSTNVNGRILIECAECDYYTSYPVTNGSNQSMSLAISSPLKYGQYYAWLEYNTFGVNWNVLDMARFSIVPDTSSVNFSQEQYFLGQSMQMRVFQRNSGYLLLKYPNSIIVQNFTEMAVLNFTYRVYNTQISSDPEGNWTAELHNATGSIVATDTATVISLTNETLLTPTPTATERDGCPSGLCSGTAWTAAETYEWLSVNLPILAWFIFIILTLTAIGTVYNIIKRRT